MNIRKKFIPFLIASKKILFVLLLGILYSEVSIFAQSNEVTTITITNARQTTYTKDEKNGNDTIVLEGSVELSVSKGGTSSEIKADKITYDRQTEMLYAEGNVEILTKSSSSGGERTTASALLMNTATLEGAFDDGRIVQTQSDALNLPSGSTLIVFSDVFGKSEKNTIAFKDSSLTFCDDENPHWHINATRTWLLPGGEFAFFNAFLFVGSVPVLYLPAFYYPKDELIFNPVFSYSRREGYSIQNTLYIYGRKPLASATTTTTTDSSSSSSADSIKALYNFMKPSSLKEQQREGLVLHNLDEDYTGNTTDYVKIMADYYSTLGNMIGIDGNLSPAPNYISKLKFNAMLGISNTIFIDSESNYVKFNPQNNTTIKDQSTFLGFTLPFRYSGNFEFGITKPFTLNVALPIYSDPFFAYDFRDNRSETMDWISYLMDSAQNKNNNSTVNISEVSSFNWTVNGSYSPKIADIFKPYVSSMSLSVNSSILISSMSAQKTAYTKEIKEYGSDWFYYTPYRKFYYPSQITPVSANINISGTLFQWPKVDSRTKAKTQEFSITLNKPEELKNETDRKKEAEEAEAERKAKLLAEQTETEEPEVDAKTQLLNEIALDVADSKELDKSTFVQPVIPDLFYTPTTTTLANGFSYKLGYTFTPSISTQISYGTANLTKSEDFDWENVRSFMYTIKAPASVTNNLSYGGEFISFSNKLSYDPVFQKHPIISDDEEAGGYSRSNKNSLILSDYNAESQNVLTTNTVSFKPFTYTEHFFDTGLSWNSTIKLYRRKFVGDAESPEWEIYGVDFDNDDCVTVNSLNLTVGAAEFNKKFKQTLVLSSVMPPQLRQYTGTLTLSFPYVTATLGTGYVEQTHDDVDVEDKWKLNPLQQSLSVSLFDSKLKFTESYNYNLEDKEHDSLKTSISYSSFNLSYVMSNALGYDFDVEEGWIPRDEKEFLPYSLSIGFAPSTKTFYRWFNRISIAPGLNTSVVADLIRPTNSYFVFTPSLTFKINEFFNLSFSSTSRNQVLYRYVQKAIGQDGLIPGEQNIFLDLINSFRFDDEDLRKASGFKLKSLNVTMSHELHDWSFNMSMKIEPKLVYKVSTQEYTYDVTPNISIGIVWNPMDSIKSNLVYEYKDSDEQGVWSLE